MRRVLVSACAWMAMVGALVLTAPAANADTPEVLLGRSRVGEFQPVKGDGALVWQQNRERTPRRYDVFARRTDGQAFRVNPQGTNAANGQLDGDVLVYQQWARGRSDVKFFDLGARSRSVPPEGVNSNKWEYWPKMDGGWLLFGRLDTKTRARQIILFDSDTQTSTKLDRVRSAKGFLAPGQVNGTFAVWSRCRPGAPCDVVRYDITSQTKEVIDNPGRDQYAPSVASDGTVYFARSRGGCGRGVTLFSQSPAGSATKLWRLPSGDNVGSTYLHENATGRRTLLYDHFACGRATSSDIWQIVDPESFELAVTVRGGGTGTVTSEPTGIACGSDCSESYDPGTVVTLTATPEPSSHFAGWEGACSGTDPTCTVTMNASRSVTATFTGNPVLTVQVNGDGTVASSPAGIDCGSDCSEAYTAGTDVTLTTTPSAGSEFAGWSGGGCSGTGTCVVDMESSVSVTATFEDLPTLTVVVIGQEGTVTGAGIACPGDCTETYADGTTVTLTAVDHRSWKFVGWSGACSTAEKTCTLTMATDQTVTATFARSTDG